MKCPKCDAENPETSRFCAECGTSLLSKKEIYSSPTKTMETPTEELTPGTTFAGRYQIIEELGTGGMGSVYKAYDTEIKEKVALKLIKPEIAADKKTIERFRNELKLARKIRHPHVCQVYDLNREREWYYIAMEYVSGEDLKGMLRMAKQLSVGVTVSIIKQVCKGLAEIHRLGVVHRDLKPSNIMIDREGNARIMDFGIARSLEAEGLTGKGVVIGTPEYMSPEQIEGKEVDARSDIYALGVILFEMLNGKRPFEGKTPLSIALKHKTEIPPDPRKINIQIPEDLSRLILRCLEKEKERRYQSAEELLGELTRIETGIPTVERALPRRKPLTTEEITTAFKKRWKMLTGLAVAVVVVVIAALYLSHEKPVPTPEKKKLVVLPFENLGAPEDEYFADGITDEIIARLTGISEMSVIAENSAMQYKKTQKTIKQIAEELGVDYILSGTIRWQKSGEGQGRVRVTPALIRASDSTHVWANVYDESISEVFQVQSDISKRVVEALGVALLEPERKTLELRPTENSEAYDYYLRGIDYSIGARAAYDERQIRLAIEMFEKAVALDPKFLQAYAQLARWHGTYYWFYFDRSQERMNKAKEAAEKAFQLDPEAAETHFALGFYYYHCQLEYDQALKHFALAQKKQPMNTQILEGIAYVKRRQGKLDEAATCLKLATEVDPLSPRIALELGTTYLLIRKYQEAERLYDRAIFLNPDSSRTFWCKTRLYLIAEGNITKARQVLEEASKNIATINPNLITYLWVLVDIFDKKYQEALARLASAPGEAFEDQFFVVPKAQLAAQIYGLMSKPELEKSSYDTARRFLEERIRQSQEDSRLISALGIAYAGLGRKNEAIEAAERATKLLPIFQDAWLGAARLQDLAQVLTMVGEYNRAFDLIEHLLSTPGELSVAWLRLDPVWSPLLTQPRFKKLLK